MCTLSTTQDSIHASPFFFTTALQSPLQGSHSHHYFFPEQKCPLSPSFLSPKNRAHVAFASKEAKSRLWRSSMSSTLPLIFFFFFFCSRTGRWRAKLRQGSLSSVSRAVGPTPKLRVTQGTVEKAVHPCPLSLSLSSFLLCWSSRLFDR